MGPFLVALAIELVAKLPDELGESHSAATGQDPRGHKRAQLVAMLQRPKGATIAQIVAATGWQPHTVRGAFAGALKKKLGLTVISEKVEGKDRVYRLE